MDSTEDRITRKKNYGNNILKTRLNQRENDETVGLKNSETTFENGSIGRKTNEVNKNKHRQSIRQMGVNVESLFEIKTHKVFGSDKTNASQSLFQKRFRTNGKNEDKIVHFHTETDTEDLTQSQLDQIIASARDITKQPIVKITRNKIYGNNISNFKLNQRVNGGIFRIEDSKMVFTPDECTIETKINEIHLTESKIERNNNNSEVDASFKRFLFQNYFEKLPKAENDMRASCNRCKSILRYATTCESLLRHLEKRHPDDYSRYQKGVEHGRIEPKGVSDEDSIAIEAKKISERIMFEDYYKLVDINDGDVAAVCRSCKVIQFGSAKSVANFQKHLEEHHPDMYEVLIHEENKIKKFGLSHDRVLFENYFQIIRRKKNEDQAANDLDESLTADRQDRPLSRQYLQTDLNENHGKKRSIRINRQKGVANLDVIERADIEKDQNRVEENIDKDQEQPVDSLNDAKKKHGDIYEIYKKEVMLSKEFKHHMAQNPNVVQKTTANIVQNQIQPIYNTIGLVEPLSKHRRNSNCSNDDGMSTASMESDHTDTVSESLVDKYVEEPVGSESDVSADEFEQTEVFERQELGLDIVKEEVDLDEFVEKEPTFYDEHGNEIDVNEFSTIDQDSNDGTSEIGNSKQVNTSDENTTTIEFKAKFQKVLFHNYFRIIETNGSNVSSECKSCRLIVNDLISTCYITRYHLRTRHPKDFNKYQKEVEQNKYEPKDVGDKNEIKVEFKEIFKRVLFKNYYKIIAKTGDSLTAVCRNCTLIQHCKDKTLTTFRNHLKVVHPDVYEKLKKDVEQSKVSIFKHHFFEINRLKNVDNEKEIKINLKSYAKQALFDKHFRIIEKNQRNLHVICNHCRSNLYGTLRNQNFRRHLESEHAEIYEKYVNDVKSHENKASSSTSEEARVSISKDRGQPHEVNRTVMVEPQSKRRRISERRNYGEILTKPVESQHNNIATRLANGKVVEASIFDAINKEKPIFIEKNTQKQIIIEENTEKSNAIENDSEELIIIENDPVEPILIEDDATDSSDGNSDGNLLHTIKPMNEKDIEIEFKTDHGRILFQKYFELALKKENNMTTSCKLCNSILKCNPSCYDLLLHFKHKHPEVHTKYQQELKRCRYEPQNIGDENQIEIEFKEKSHRILFKAFFKIIAINEDYMTTVCRRCKLIQKTKESFSNLRYHLEGYHPHMYRMLREEEKKSN